MSTDLVIRDDARIAPIGERSLEELADIANREYAAVSESLHSALAHAFNLGSALLEAHDLVGYVGGWDQWCAGNLRFGVREAAVYEHMAHHRQLVPPELLRPWVAANGNTLQPSVSRVAAYLSSLRLPRVNKKGSWLPRDTRDEIKRLRAAADPPPSYKAIARLVGTNATTVRRVLDPEFAERERVRAKESARERRAGKQALAMSTRRARARHAGKSLGEAYSCVRRALQCSEWAAGDAQAADVREALRSAQSALNAAEDALVRAMKVAS